MDECVVCRVRHGGHVVGYRNHAHRLARDVFSEHTDARGVALPLLGRMSAQRPQVIRLARGRVSGVGFGLGLPRCRNPNPNPVPIPNPHPNPHPHPHPNPHPHPHPNPNQVIRLLDKARTLGTG